jgi:hypothetical protein
MQESVMDHRSISELGEIARVFPEQTTPWQRRRERLERWAALLDRQPGTARLFSSIEYMPREQRALIRADRSPLTIAYQDPLFRAQGLRTDRLGDAMAFFDLSQGEAHHLLCDCHYGSSAVDTGTIARRVRSVARKPTSGEIWTKLQRAIISLWR